VRHIDKRRLIHISILVSLFVIMATVNHCCAHPQYIPTSVSMELWTDAPGEPDPLAECHRVTGEGACVVMSVRALAFWMSAWQGCEEKLETCKEK